MTDPVNAGTFNYCNPDVNHPLTYIGHFLVDVGPCYILRNNSNDNTTPVERIIGPAASPIDNTFRKVGSLE